MYEVIASRNFEEETETWGDLPVGEKDVRKSRSGDTRPKTVMEGRL